MQFVVKTATYIEATKLFKIVGGFFQIDQRTCEHRREFLNPVPGRYVLVKLIRAHVKDECSASENTEDEDNDDLDGRNGSNLDLQHIAFWGRVGAGAFYSGTLL